MVSKKTKIYSQEVMSKMRPIGKIRMDYVKKNIVPFFIVKEDKKTGFCTMCGKEMEISKLKHNQKCNCPSCNHKVHVIHSWRRQLEKIEKIIWYAFPQVIDEHTVVIRYILAHCLCDKVFIGEEAREIIDLNNPKNIIYLEKNVDGNYYNSKRTYFRYPTFYMGNRFYCCLADEIEPYFFSELSKLKGAKYNIDVVKKYYSKTTAINANIFNIYSRIDLLEKLDKINLMDKLQLHNIKYDKTQSELTKMLGLNKNSLKILRKYPSNKALEWLQMFPNCTEDDFIKSEVIDYNISNKRFLETLGITINQFYKYMNQQNEANNKKGFFLDYNDYVRSLKKLKYRLDKGNLFPKNFRKAKDRLSIEQIKAESAKDIKRNIIIKQISNLIRENNELSNWIKGENGLQIYVPESVEDLRLEGKRLHNCIGTYVERIAAKNTLVFFVRKLSDPNREYVAFEYNSSGKVVQIREDRNHICENDNVISFVTSFCNMLNKVNVYKMIA